MKKWTALVMALAMVALLVTGCGEADPEKEAAAVVAEVNGEKITKGEAMDIYDFVLNQTVMYAAQQGETLDTTDETVISSLKAQALAIMTETLVLDQKLRELGGGLTEEDRAKVKEDAQNEYDLIAQSYIDTYAVTREDANAMIDSMGFTLPVVEYMLYGQEVVDRLRPLADLQTEITDEQIQAKYEALGAEQEETYSTSPTQFINDFISDATIYVRPEGFRLVKNLVIGFSDELEAQMDEKDSEGYALGAEQYNLLIELYGTADITDERKAELETQMAALDDEMLRVEDEIKALIAQGHEEEKAHAEEILALAQAEGADFDALMAEYSVDEATGVPIEQGYPVAQDITYYVPEFTEGAMALENVGDMSGLIASDYGYHILLYVADITPGPVPFEEVRETVEAALRTELEEEAYIAKENEWLNEANIKTYINRF